jgi:lipoyl(octanoyl) transferase
VSALHEPGRGGVTDRVLHVEQLGRRPYGEVLDMQRAIAAERIAGARPDTLLLVEHDPVVTLGRSTKAGNLVANPDLLAARGAELFEIERGGDVTFHGPGQLVGYPIIDLSQHRQDLHWYLRQLEQVIIDAIAPFGIVGGRVPAYTGVWTGDRKIASIGVHARSWVTWHGFALNVSTDLSWFDLMVPCGIQGVTMTSMVRETGVEITLGDVSSHVVQAFGRSFDLEPSFPASI